MLLAAAQFNPIDGDLDGNLREHYRFIGEASDQGADLIVFPEMSLTGYVRDAAHDLAFSATDSRLNELRRLSVEKQITIVVGAPIKVNNQLFIGAFIVEPKDSMSIYTKQYLHQGEEEFFNSSFAYHPAIAIKGQQISFAICADIENPKHPADASANRTTIYIASIFYTPGGMDQAY